MSEPTYTIKPLVWRYGAARTLLGTYYIPATSEIYNLEFIYTKDETQNFPHTHLLGSFPDAPSARACAESHWQEKIRECLTPVPAPGREIARMEGQCDEADGVVYTGKRMEPPLIFEYCPNHATPGTTPVEIIVREREADHDDK